MSTIIIFIGALLILVIGVIIKSSSMVKCAKRALIILAILAILEAGIDYEKEDLSKGTGVTVHYIEP